MTNKTQCPECFTVFMITDEQLIRSKGKVRCGRCRSAFTAQLVPTGVADNLDKQQEDTAHPTNHDEGVSDNNYSKTVPPSSIAKSPISEQNDDWDNPHGATLIHSASDNSEISELDSTSRLVNDPEPSAYSSSIEPSIDKGYTVDKELSKHSEISYRSDMLGGFSEPISDHPNERPVLDKKSDRFFSEAMEAIDNAPSFSLDDYTGTDAIEEEFDRTQFETKPAYANEEPIVFQEEPSASSEEPSAIDQQPSAKYDQLPALDTEPLGSFETLSTIDEQPSANNQDPVESDEEPSAYEEPSVYEEPSAYEEPSVYEEPLAAAEESPETGDDSSATVASQEEQILVDAFSNIDDTASLNIEGYRESSSENAESFKQQSEDEHLASENSIGRLENRADQVLSDTFSDIDETASLNLEDYSESTFNDVESAETQIQDNIVSEPGISVPPKETIETNDDPLTADASTALEESSSLPTADDTSIEEVNAELFDAKTPDSSQFSEPTSDQVSELDTSAEEEAQAQQADQSLITEVDQLIEDKLVIESIEIDKSEIIEFSKTKKHSALGRWVYSPLLVLMAVVLIAVLGYQLWLKQAAPILESAKLATAIEPITKPLKQQLQSYDIILPERRNLNQLELLSARTEAHPTRSSTILLRASLINRAKISQPFPWVELSLTDEDGKLVSRRALSPNDYLHNNQLENIINANELKQVTIELLAFPKQAHGFELRLINK